MRTEADRTPLPPTARAGPAPAGAPLLRVLAVDCGVRDMHLRLPFRFGAVTLERCPQLFVRATVAIADHGTAVGWAAEMMVPRWFDKRPQRSQVDNVDDLRRSVEDAAAAYLDAAALSAFGLFERHQPALSEAGAARGATALSTAFGQAVLDRAVLDALCRATGRSVFDAFRQGLVGMAASPLAPDLADWDWPAWLSGLAPAGSIHARHTVGMLDALDALDALPGDDADPHALPQALPAVIRRYGHRYFKIKLGGQPGADLARLDEVLATLDAARPGHRFTLDGNEQYRDAATLLELCDGLRGLPRLAARPEALLYIEQPLPREASMDRFLRTLAPPAPLLLDEADGSLDAFAAGREHGWCGISSKGCKGIYKALINRARCDLWNEEERRQGRAPRYFMSAEDLTCQAGIAVQQDLAIAALLGLPHAERNGHHYVDGFGTAPADEQAAFARAHPALYTLEAGRARLRIVDGEISLATLDRTGFAHAAEPDFDSLRPLREASAMVQAPTA